MMFPERETQPERLKPKLRVLKELMRQYAERGKTLEHISDRRITGLSVRTLQRYARRWNLRFTDYVPRKLKTLIEGGSNEPPNPKERQND